MLPRCTYCGAVPGIASPNTIDTITVSKDGATCTLYIVETEQWGAHADFELLKEKLENYVTYATQGQLQSQYPQLDGASVRIQIDLYFELEQTAEADLDVWREALKPYGVGLDWSAGLSLDAEP